MSRAVRDLKKETEVPKSTTKEIAARELAALKKHPDIAAQKGGRGSGSFREGGIHDSKRSYFSKK
ncbi:MULTISPECIES: hypothetical protein [Vibrio]|uniref:hypothetical protein n=1 Tax=Vibrio TaxID=662 RepID=UPI000C84E37D|nr:MULTISPECIES: hypothetical protein [Vibrio]MBE8608001.1 hypothetical protein [Vibrio sp. OPT10]PMH53480.1 hypothetical protein BCU65_18045 [Vibrio cyclitrophicus]